MKVTAHKTQIQALLADIDGLLGKTGGRLSWVMSRDAAEHRQILERVRDYLAALLQETDEPPEAVTGPEAYRPLAGGGTPEESPAAWKATQDQISQTLVQQLGDRFSQFMQPLQTELEALLSQRQSLVQEIRQLELHRQQDYSLTQQQANQQQMIAEFLQVLSGHLQESLKQQLAQTLANLEAQFLEIEIATELTDTSGYTPASNLNPASNNSNSSDSSPPLHPKARVEQLQLLQSELDRRIQSLDSTINIVFETLQRNVQTYQQSLSQALEKMHQTGVQGEQVFATLVNQVMQSGRGGPASGSYSPSADAPYFNLTNSPPKLALPYPGAELLGQTSLLSSQTAASPSLGGAIPLGDATNPPNTATNTPTPNLPLDLSGLDFSSFEAADSDMAEINTLIQLDQPGMQPQEADATVLQLLEGEQSETAAVEPQSELDFILAQLGLDLTTNTPNTADLGTQNPDQLPQDDVNELYESLFGSAPIIDSQPVEPESTDTITALTDLRWEPLSEDQPAPTPHSTENQSNRAEINTASVTQPGTSDEPIGVEDSYTPASPTENLLVPEPEPNSVHDILLDLETLEQLNEDLSNLERPEVKLPATSVHPPAPTEASSTQPGSPTSPVGNVESSSPLPGPTIPTSIPAPLESPPPLDQTPSETEKKNLTPTDSHQLEQDPPLFSASTQPGDFRAAPNASGSASLVREHSTSTDSWFLGIDVGTTGLSAALSNQSTGELYPLYWSAHDYPDPVTATRSFRLPSVAFLPVREEMGRERDGEVGRLATASALTAVTDHPKCGVLVKNLKPYLKVGLPYNAATGNCEPVLQLNEQQTVSLSLCVSLLSTLLATLNPAFASGANSAGVVMPVATVAATGIEPQTLRAVLSRVTAVIFSCPDGWSEQYRFNLREAVLNAQLVAHPEQVLFVEEAIATVLSQLGASSCKSLELPGLSSRKRTEDSRWRGGTVVINAGATMTELAIVDLPENLQTLAHSDFTLHNLPYAGNAIDQDIVCQLLYPQKWQQSPSPHSNDADWSLKDGWSWRSRLPNLDDLHWDSLQLEQLDLPRPGEPDLPTRIKLQQRLESSLLGQTLLEAAGHLKLILQHEEQFTLSLADRQWNLQRRDLETLVFLPFVRRLNRELNKLLVATGTPVEAINQVICTGGTASLSAIARWLRQKLPKATIVQDLYRSDQPYACSRVAYGLAMLPLLPQVLEEHRQQYSDYFLLLELLRSLPDTDAKVGRPYRLSEIILLLERRGINTRACQHRLVALLEGRLPPGLVPSFADTCWLTQASQENLDYQKISAAPLFERQANLLYLPNPQQLRRLRHYLSTILTDTHQKLEEPCAVNFFVS